MRGTRRLLAATLAIAAGAGLTTTIAGAAPAVRSLDGAELLRFEGGGRFGTEVEGTPDLTGDGVPDLLTGSPFAAELGRAGAGSATVLPGGPGGGLRGGGHRFLGPEPGGALGSSVASGDLDGDGRADVALGSPQADPAGRTNAGTVHVVTAWSGPQTDLADPADWSGFRIIGVTNDQAGFEIDVVEDMTGDGIAELLVGAPGVSRAYVVPGRTGGGDVDLDTDAVLVIQAPSTWRAGFDVATVGDVDGDGRDDVALAAPDAAPNGRTGAGVVVVVHGRPFSARTAVGAAALTPSEGFTIQGEAPDDRLNVVRPAGDADRDGRPDLLVAGSGADRPGRPDAGVVWLVRGGGGSLDLAARAGRAFRYLGGAANDLTGFGVGAGDVDADGRTDVVLGTSNREPSGAWVVGDALRDVDLGDPAVTGLTRLDAPRADEAGFAVAVADVTGRAAPDVAVGRPLGRGGAGLVTVVDLQPVVAAVETTLALPGPVFSERSTVRAAGGTVRIRVPGGPVELLGERRLLPDGTVVDVREGKIDLLVEPRPQTSVLSQLTAYEGIFRLDLAERPGVPSEVVLTERFEEDECDPRDVSEGRERSRAAGRRSELRHLWGDSQGRFRVRGRAATATVRGAGTRRARSARAVVLPFPSGLVRVGDFCDGTEVQVRRGGVTVTRAGAPSVDLGPRERRFFRLSGRG